MEEIQRPESELLLRRAATGDRAAQVELLDGHRDRLRRMIANRFDRRLAARVDASDIVQEALNNAFGRLPEYFAKPQCSFYMWLRRIACDRLVDMYRMHLGTEKRSVLREQPIAPNSIGENLDELSKCLAASSLGPDRCALLAEAQAGIMVALAQLKPSDREILVLRYQEQLGVKEIADVLGISRTAVTSRHLRALRRLRQLLGVLGAC